MGLHSPTGSPRKGFLLALLTACMWGGLPVALKLLLQDIDAYSLTFVRFVAATLILGSYLAAFRKLQMPRLNLKITRVRMLILIAAFGLGGNYITYIASLQYISASTAQVVIQLAPIFLIIGSVYIFRESFSRLQWSALAVLLIGFIMFFNDRLPEMATVTSNLSTGLLLILLSSVTWAVYAMAQKQILVSMDSMHVMLWIYTICSIAFAPTFETIWLASIGPHGIGLLVFVSVNTVVAYGAFSESLNHWEASKVSAVLAVTPLMTIAIGAAASTLAPTVVPSEPLNLLSYGGAILVMLGSAAIALGKSKRPV